MVADGAGDEDLDIDIASGSLFKEPDGFYVPDKPASFCHHDTRAGERFRVRLVGESPLWGHLLWNAARVTTDYLEENTDTLILGKSVLELGAGAGLPSLFCACHGARKVVVTDYPDEELIWNLGYNIQHSTGTRTDDVVAEGYLWGQSTDHLVAHLPKSPAAEGGFDLVILADLLFNHSEHEKLVLSLQNLLKHSPKSVALAFFTPHRPWLFQKDLAFFDLARKGGFVVKKVLERKMDQAMEAESRRKSSRDGGDESERKIVFGYELRWADLT